MSRPLNRLPTYTERARPPCYPNRPVRSKPKADTYRLETAVRVRVLQQAGNVSAKWSPTFSQTCQCRRHVQAQVVFSAISCSRWTTGPSVVARRNRNRRQAKHAVVTVAYRRRCRPGEAHRIFTLAFKEPRNGNAKTRQMSSTPPAAEMNKRPPCRRSREEGDNTGRYIWERIVGTGVGRLQV
jgi:hypothetical protein